MQDIDCLAFAAAYCFLGVLVEFEDYVRVWDLVGVSFCW